MTSLLRGAERAFGKFSDASMSFGKRAGKNVDASTAAFKNSADDATKAAASKESKGLSDAVKQERVPHIDHADPPPIKERPPHPSPQTIYTGRQPLGWKTATVFTAGGLFAAWAAHNSFRQDMNDLGSFVGDKWDDLKDNVSHLPIPDMPPLPHMPQMPSLPPGVGDTIGTVATVGGSLLALGVGIFVTYEIYQRVR